MRTSPDCKPNVTSAFFDLLFGNCPPDAWLLVWTLPNKRSTWHPLRDLDKAATFASSCSSDTYFGAGLSPENFGPSKRCPAEQVAGIVGVWADLDIQGDAHKKKSLPETVEQARELADSLGISPTVSVDSGHGLQAYWLFHEPWMFLDDGELQQAQQLVERFQAALRRNAEAAGWSLDSTHDLARVLRVPGTTNCKIEGQPVPVQILDANHLRYNPATLAALVEPTPTIKLTASAGCSAVERARRYVAKMPSAISGNGGHQTTFNVAQVLVRGFALSVAEARPLLREYSARCDPPWTDAELEHKLESAEAKSRLPRGYLLAKSGNVPPSNNNGDGKPAVLTNYGEKTIKKKDGSEKKVRFGLSASQIARALMKITNGWPKRVEGRLFVEEGNELLWLESTNALFAWIGRQLPNSAANPILWAQGDDKVSQGEFTAHLQQTVESFEAVESMPHEPKLPGIWYAHPKPTCGDGHALSKLLNRFEPATMADLDLIRALFLSAFWGGPPGQRPAWLIESEPDDPEGGRGVGKSKLAQAVARLAGGHIDARPNEEIDKLMTRLLSPAAMDRRIAFLDNVKTLRFSWSDLEALVTGDIISGRCLYVGEGRRPNLLTWIITLNQASLSRDMAQRTIPIRLKRPDHDPKWEAETWGLIEMERWAIIGDILAELLQPVKRLEKYSRWSAWEQSVLAHVGDPAECQKVIEERQEMIDDDKAEADLVRDTFVQTLIRRGHKPDTEYVWIASREVAVIVNTATGEGRATNRAIAYLNTLSIPELRKCDYHGSRGFAWRGKKTQTDTPLRDMNAEPPFCVHASG